MDNYFTHPRELEHIKEVFGHLDLCISLAIESKDTGQWDHANYEHDKIIRLIDDIIAEHNKVLGD